MDGETAMKIYEVTVTRDDNLWAAVVHGLPPHVIGATDAERLADLESDVYDLVAALTDSDLGRFRLTWRYVVNGRDVTDRVVALRRAEGALEEAMMARDEARRSLLKALADIGLSQSAIGDMLGVSHQRIHQLLKAG
jgi:DNA-directed RNA polymerase specialized sigma24 family protein